VREECRGRQPRGQRDASICPRGGTLATGELYRTARRGPRFGHVPTALDTACNDFLAATPVIATTARALQGDIGRLKAARRRRPSTSSAARACGTGTCARLRP
jgi:hypothetical protein